MNAVITSIKKDVLIESKADFHLVLIEKMLKDLGFIVSEISVVSVEESIDKILNNYLKAIDLVVLIGGLDTVESDVFKSVIGDFLENDTNLPNQILIKPEVLYSDEGVAFGKFFKINNTYYIYTNKSQSNFSEVLKKLLPSCINSLFSERARIYRNVIVYSASKEELVKYLADWKSTLSKEFSLSFFSEEIGVRLNLSTANKELETVLDEKYSELLKELHTYVISEEDESLEITVAKLFESSKKTISFAESCTGGRFSQLFSSISGASAYFKGGVVTYSTQSKIDVLGVSAGTIDKFSVVSEEVALEMASSVRDKFKSDYAIATTGNAGPDKGDSEAEVGTVYIGVSTPNGTFAKKYIFNQSREEVVNSAILKGLELICKEILKNK